MVFGDRGAVSLSSRNRLDRASSIGREEADHGRVLWKERREDRIPHVSKVQGATGPGRFP